MLAAYTDEDKLCYLHLLSNSRGPWVEPWVSPCAPVPRPVGAQAGLIFSPGGCRPDALYNCIRTASTYMHMNMTCACSTSFHSTVLGGTPGHMSELGAASGHLVPEISEFTGLDCPRRGTHGPRLVTTTQGDQTCIKGRQWSA